MKYLNTKVKYYNGKCTTNFYYNGIPPKENTEHTCFPIASENYYPQSLLEECKYAKRPVKASMMIKHDEENDVDKLIIKHVKTTYVFSLQTIYAYS